MPVQFSIDPSAGLVSYAVEGEVTAPEAYGFLDAALTDPAFRRGFRFLGDRRRSAAPTAGYVGAIAGLLRSRAGSLAPCRWAVVVSSEEEFGAVRMWSLMVRRAGVEVAPFVSEARARAWLAEADDTHGPIAATQ